MIIWEGREEPPFTTGLFTAFWGVQKREESPAENCSFEKGMGSTEKAFPPVSVPPTALGGEEDAQEREKERARSSFHLVSSHACVCPFECRNLSQHFANTVPYTLYCLLCIPENCTWWALAWSPVESRRKMLKSELKRQYCFSWLEDNTTEVYPYYVPFSLVLLGLGDFFDETCLFSIKPNKSCLSMYLTKVTSDPIYPLFITVRRVVLRLGVLVLRP